MKVRPDRYELLNTSFDSSSDTLKVTSGEPLFEAVVNATEESIINALVAGRTMMGHEGHKIVGINHKRLQEILDSHNRLSK